MVMSLIETFEQESIDDWRRAVDGMISSILPVPQYPYTHGRVIEFMGRRYRVFECVLTSVIIALVFWGGRSSLPRAMLFIARGEGDSSATAAVIADGKETDVDATEAVKHLTQELTD